MGERGRASVSELALVLEPLVAELAERVARRLVELQRAERESAGAPERSPWIGIAQAAVYLDWPRQRLYKLTAAGAIPHYKQEGRLLFRRDELEGLEALVAAGERSERTLEHYRYHLERQLLPALGHKRLSEISTDDCARLIASLRARGLSAKTIAGALVPLGRVFSLALRRGYV